MSGAKIVVTTDLKKEAKEAFTKAVGESCQVSFLSEVKSRKEALAEAEVVVSFFFNREVHKEEYELLGNVRLLQAISAGVDYLPFREIPAHIQIASNAGGWAYQIAEHTLALVMALYKRLVPLHNRLARGEFANREYLLRNVCGKTFGVVGFGGIGRLSARIMKSLGMKVMALNTSGRTDENVDYIGTMSDLDHLLAESDVVLLGLPLTKYTNGLMDRAKLRKMKSDAVIINVARAPLIVEKDLYEHLRDNPEFMAGLDVWWQEPSWSDSGFSLNYPFFELDNFIGSPHNSNYTAGSVEKAAQIAGQNVRAFLNGEKYAGKVVREDYLYD